MYTVCAPPPPKYVIVFFNFQAHTRECKERLLKCDKCSSPVKRRCIQDHKENHCPYVECLCGQQVGLHIHCISEHKNM